MEGETVKNKEHPLAGVVLCFTSILPEQRSKLAEIAGQMGAIHKYDLTSDVTHLLVGETNTEKYKFVARERSDVLVLMPEWIEAVRQSWMDGGDTDLHALEQKYRLPTFYGLSICVTGFEDASYRNYLQETTIANGAEFRKDLTKTVTHLIAHQPSGQKYKFATQWQIKVVTAKWFSDSLERGMILDETRYDPLLPPHEQGVGAWNRGPLQVPIKRKTTSESSNIRSRKLRRVASSKLGEQNEGIWGDIIGSGFSSSDKGNSVSIDKRSSVDTQTKENSVAQQNKTLNNELLADRSSPVIPDERTSVEQNGFLQGCYFYIHGFTSKQVDVLRHHLVVNGANLVQHLSDFSSHNIPKNGKCLYIISSYKIPRSEVPSTDDKGFSCEQVTDMWLERCLDANSLVSPEIHVMSTPFPHMPLKGFEGLKICSTGFAGIDLLHISKMVSVMGAQYEEYLTPNVSVLISNDSRAANTEKIRHALGWGIPVVSADWLWISVQSGKMKVFEPYMLHKSTTQTKEIRHEQSKAVPERSGIKHELFSSCSEANANSHVRQTSASAFELNDSACGEIHETLKPSVSNIKMESMSSVSRPPTEGGDNKASQTPVKTVSDDNSVPQSNRSSENLESSMNRFLKKARELTRARSILGGENGSRRRRPNLGRRNSSSSSKMEFKRTDSHVSVSSIDTLNEDGYGSAVSADTDVNNQLTARLSRNLTGQSLSSLLSSSKFTRYLDSPIPENDESLDEENGTPAMTQLNYEDPNAMAAREEIMRLARRGNVNEAHVTEILKQKEAIQPQAVVDEFPQVIDHQGGRMTARRTRRSAGKQQEEGFL
ncbi:BRCT domain protein [Talaromyces stipitatus ATCC 10500]|uniref:BRCT domain protein n=1 Tax=Talaromyces stipitatus (strain ATCC 10500 / CBS 375.48 / QM 6759 / NRRL 1006) TaxID=441959 RepID=B8LYE8_TALSN|nr:BRCT domain protein [Talaromyces stipitatus ATCC 10500]EED22877.1 BRCT domain protein [Talaromyces stipitatus ATCC 10500]